jgi:hypothetical protein
MMRRFGLRDDQWERIKDLLPGREGSVGGIYVDLDVSAGLDSSSALFDCG